MNSRVTMADVARAAGVSTATVSRVLAGNRPVAPEYREAVERAADDLGYRVNLVGRALRKQTTATVGLVLPDLGNPFFSSLASHLSQTFEGSGIDLLIFTSGNELAVERRGVASFLGRQVTALILVPCHERASAETAALAARTTTLIQLDRRTSGLDAHFVGCSNSRGMKLIAKHVAQHVDLDRQPLVYVGAGEESSSGRERRKGYLSSFPGAGETPHYTGSFSFDWGQQAADLVLTDGIERATIIAAADVIALGFLARMHRLSRSVPDEFRIIGFDGIGVAPFAHPSLTTVRQPVERIGEAILRLVLETPSEQQRIRITPTLELGESSPAS